MLEVPPFLSEGLPPELVWGLVPRFVGLLYAVAFLSLRPQVVPLVGARGIAPVRTRLQRMRADYPGPRRFLQVPSLLWLNASDGALRALPWLGLGASLIAIWGGEAGPWALGVCWVVLLSLDVCCLMFPWDCLLFEAGFLALWLPGVPGLSETVRAETLPLPALAFMWRLFILRLMWGFAKLKFIGTQPGDSMYLRGFLAWLPMPTPLGWLAQHAPRPFLRAAYGFMWLAEVVCPLLGFFSGMPRVLGGIGLVALMGGIWATGNWGYFNLGYGLLCIVLLDAHSTLGDIGSLSSLWATPQAALTHAMLAVIAFCSLFYFLFNSWCSQTWVHWPFEDLTYKRPWLHWLVSFFRLLAPFRIVNAYGVFPPNSSPPIKNVPVFQGSDDGQHWHDFRFKFIPTRPEHRPPVVAPHHPRVDHLIIYAGAGMDDANYLSATLGSGRPYGFSTFSHASWVRRLAERLLEGTAEVRTLLADDNPFPDAPPRYVRVVATAVTPTTLSHRRQTGQWWQTRPTSILIPATEKTPDLWKHWIPPPECLHPDQVSFRKQSPALRGMLGAFARGEPHEEAVRTHSPLTAADVEAFWTVVIPRIDASDRYDWTHLEATATALRQELGEARMHTFERILERYAFALRVRLEPHLYGDATPHIAKRSNFRVHLLLHEMILDGRDAFAGYLQDPGRAAERAERQTDASALYTAAIFHYEMIRYHAASMRLADRVAKVTSVPLPGIFEFAELLKSYDPGGELWLPSCRQLPNGEWHAEGFGIPRAEDRTLDPA